MSMEKRLKKLEAIKEAMPDPITFMVNFHRKDAPIQWTGNGQHIKSLPNESRTAHKERAERLIFPRHRSINFMVAEVSS